ncbi:MAG: D-3-phosphoglycerate dehydrogenase / 2-oxoglutarate reductase [Rikenellaceae bacterium]|nr:D-3-phosphoglycerate dehydrogenase / 2-oxoglutarate reductase [Rikenellaceae bacterium]
MNKYNNIIFLDSTHEYLPNQFINKGFQVIHHYDLPEKLNDDIRTNVIGLVVRSRVVLDKKNIDLFPQLRFIARAGSGIENIDTIYANQKGIVCINSPEGNRIAVAEHVIGMLLSLMNNILKAHLEIHNGFWKREANRGYELDGKTFGIIGYGNVGSAVAERLQGFNMHVIAYDKYKHDFSNNLVEEVSLNELLTRSDIISMHVPLTSETTYMVNNNFFSKLSKPIWFINTSRGQVLETNSLLNAIANGKVLGACLDVLEYEDYSFENIESALANPNETLKQVLDNPKIILTPHIAGWTFESNRKHAEILWQKLIYYNLV